MSIPLCPEFALPDEAVTQTFGILAVRGAGKSNTAAVMAEGMAARKLPFVVVDVVGNWWGLRSARDGKAAGLVIPIFGGQHADVPLERTSGLLVADLVAERRLSCVLDLFEFSETDKTRFLIDFAERLYRKNTDPLHLYLEEADDYIPQRPMREQARLVRAWENIVRRGRARGLGMTMITQRSAALNKNVLTQIETLVAMRTTSPQDRKAIEAWVSYHGEDTELVDSLPTLKDGEAWIWSPSWLGIQKRIQIARRTTFDSAATPKMVAGHRPPATLADVDLDAIKGRMAETIERAKQEDPRELRARIRELEAELRKANSVQLAQAPPKPEAASRRVEVPVLRKADLARLEKLMVKGHTLAGALFDLKKKLEPIGDEISKAASGLGGKIEQARVPSPAVAVAAPLSSMPTVAPRPRPSPAPCPRGPDAASTVWMPPARADVVERLPRGELGVLRACGQFGRLDRQQLTVLVGYKKTARDTYLYRLRSRGYLAVGQDGAVEITDAGRQALGSDYEPLPTGPALRDYWLSRLPQGERRVLDALIKHYANAVDRESLGELTGYKKTARDTYLYRLSARQLVTFPARGTVRAAKELF